MNQQNHLFWRSLIEVSGPFLEVQVLEKYLPQGFPKLNKYVRKKVVQAYNEWYEAVDTESPLLPKLHSEWIRIVLEDLLEFDSTVLKSDDKSLKSIEQSEGMEPSFVLYNSEKPQLLIDIYPPDTPLLEPSKNIGFIESPVEKMTNLCKKSKCKIGLLSNGEEWILVNATEPIYCGYSIWYSKYWWLEPITLRAFHSLLEVRRFFGPEEEKLPSLFRESGNYTEEVTNSLGNQVKRAIEILVQSLDKADQDRNRELLKGIDPKELYDASLIIMMRLVFVMCAEERGLLLSGDPLYDEFYAASTLRSQLNEQASLNGDSFLINKYDAWSRLMAIFRVLYYGIEHENFRLAPLGGSLFHPDKYPFLEGRVHGQQAETAIPLPVNNLTVLKLLNSLEVLSTPYGNIVMSYKALDVEQIGHVYEGLLEYTVKRADKNLLGLKTSKNIENNLFPVDGLSDLTIEQISKLTGRAPKTIEKEIEADTKDLLPKLISICGDEESLIAKTSKFLNLTSLDPWGELVFYKINSYIVVPGPNRRDTGAHYTPKELTEEIVNKSLEPTLKNLRLAYDPNYILSLKVCDPTMGSGAFLVQACEVLSQALIKAWEFQISKGERINLRGRISLSPEKEELMPEDIIERRIYARRLIAEQVLYGVDINPLAVELSKLSLWLFTLSKGKPLEFLDHNLKVGDALFGVISIKKIENLNLKDQAVNDQLPLFKSQLRTTLTELIQIREAIDSIHSKSMDDIKTKSSLNTKFKRLSKILNQVSDLLLIATLQPNLIGAENSTLNEKIVSKVNFLLNSTEEELTDYIKKIRADFDTDLPDHKPKRNSFHWGIEFPEVFARENPGFDIIIGNPPFLWNRNWKPTLGANFQLLAQYIMNEKPGKINLCLVFLHHAVDLLRNNGVYNLIAISNIAEGDSVEKGPALILKKGSIISAQKDLPWPGKASVDIAILNFFKGEWDGDFFINGKKCKGINAKLEAEIPNDWAPQKIKNIFYAFEGVNNSKGQSFLIDESSTWYSKLNSEKDSLLTPYITGDDITTFALLNEKKYALDIGSRSLKDIKIKWPIAYDFLLNEVKPYRDEDSLKSYPKLLERWWQFWNVREKQFKHIRKSSTCIVFSKSTKYPICLSAPSEWLYTSNVLIIGNDREDSLAICLSNFFRTWVTYFSGGKLEGRLKLSISQSINKFALPKGKVPQEGIDAAETFVENAITFCSKNNIGMTKLIALMGDQNNQVKDIVGLRDLQKKIDAGVSKAYNFPTPLTYEFRQTPRSQEFVPNISDEDLILSHLKECNRIEHLKENNKTKKKSISKKKKKTNYKVIGKKSQQTSLFDEES